MHDCCLKLLLRNLIGGKCLFSCGSDLRGPCAGLMQLAYWGDREDLRVLSALSGLHTLCLTDVHWRDMRSEAYALSVFDVSGAPLSIQLIDPFRPFLCPRAFTPADLPSSAYTLRPVSADQAL